MGSRSGAGRTAWAGKACEMLGQALQSIHAFAAHRPSNDDLTLLAEKVI